MVLFFVCILFVPGTSYSQLNQFHFEQIDSIQKVKKKPLFVFLNTSWCKYCIAMKQTSFKHLSVIESLNTDYYFVSFDPEIKKDILFNNHLYKYISTGYNTGYNELAEELGRINNEITYPAICILNAKNEIEFQLTGFLSAKDLLRILGNQH